ncbi:hypothetical protein Hanom_Chr14g01257561 [Helianthus anomalus]
MFINIIIIIIIIKTNNPINPKSETPIHTAKTPKIQTKNCTKNLNQRWHPKQLHVFGVNEQNPNGRFGILQLIA